MNTKKLFKGCMEAAEHLVICAVFGCGLSELLKKAPLYVTIPVAITSGYIVSYHALNALGAKAVEDIVEGLYGEE